VSGVAGRALAALVLLAAVAKGGAAQDTTVAVARHVLPLDVARLQPFRRAYDMIVHSRDTAVVIGQRELTLSPATYAGNPAWMLVENRSGLVPAVETLYVAPDMRPLHWYSAQGAAQLGAEFVGDTIFGAMRAPGGKQSLVVAGRPDLLVTQGMIEALLPLLPLTSDWTDSAGVLAVDMASGTVIPAELSVIGEEEMLVDSVLARPAWVVALRADSRNVLFWVDKENGVVHRIQQPLPLHVGSLLEYRRRPDAATPSPPPPPPPTLPRPRGHR